MQRQMALGVVAAGGAALACAVRAAAQPRIWLVNPPEGWTSSSVNAVSADGAWIAGNAETPAGSRAFRWSLSTGPVDLGTFPSGTLSVANGISGDGSTVVGTGIGLVGIRPFRWTEALGMEDLGRLSTDATHNFAYAASRDGTVVVGESENRAFRWTQGGGMENLGTLSEFSGSSARSVSGSGQVVVGRSGPRAFWWTAGSGMVDIGTLPGSTYVQSMCVSDDGLVVAGTCPDASSRQRPYWWTAATGMTELALPNGADSASVANVSADGWIVVGSAGVYQHPETWTSVLWINRGPAVQLGSYLAGMSVNLSGWELGSAWAVSADGSAIIGNGSFNGAPAAWIVTGLPTRCYANCDGSITQVPCLNVNDFGCFINRFAAGDERANCDRSMTPPTLNVLDFQCFLNRFAAGCSSC